MSSTLSLNAQVDDEGRFVFLPYGFAAEGECDDVRVSIDDKWNIRRKWVALCTVKGPDGILRKKAAAFTLK